MPAPACPHHGTCNFFKMSRAATRPDVAALNERYCHNKANCAACYRSHFARRYGANLSADISPNALLLKGVPGDYQPSCLATDQAARLFASPAA